MQSFCRFNAETTSGPGYKETARIGPEGMGEATER